MNIGKNKKLIAFVFLLFVGAIIFSLLFLKEDSDEVEIEDVSGELFTNEELGYSLKHPFGWEVEAKRRLNYLNKGIERTEVRDIELIDEESYRQIASMDLIGSSPLVYIDGEIKYVIEKNVYSNKDNLTLRQWYDLGMLVLAFEEGIITEGELIQSTNSRINDDTEIREDDAIFNPWVPRGEDITINGRDVIKFIMPGDYRYEGYQYYVAAVSDYFFVFNFGFGGPVTPREMWSDNDEYVKDMIRSLEIL